nr:MAG TPA: hypothetical protein [Caudoviricetes sp.]
MSYLKQEHNISLLAWLRYKKSTGFYITFDTLTDKMIKDTTIDNIYIKEGIFTNYIN